MNWPIDLINKANEILNKISSEDITPSKENVLRFLQLDPSLIKVVIVGQDPYPTRGVANGNAFAVNKGCKIPASLRNIFKEIQEVNGSVETDETLSHWTDQGVLLLNKSLTTIVGQSNAHKKYWNSYTDELIKWIDVNIKPIWVLWGNDALKIKPFLTSEVISDFHPSPLSVRHRNKNTFKLIKSINW